MSLLHENSHPATKNELSLFEVPPSQVVIDESQLYPCTLVNSLSDTSNLTFTLDGAGDYYLDLQNTYLYVKCRILKNDGTRLTQDEPNRSRVACVNNTLHSLWSQIDCYIGGKLMTSTTPTHAYKAMIENVLKFSKEKTDCQNACIGLYNDTNIGNVNFEGDHRNTGHMKRYNRARGSAEMEFYGPLTLDILNLNKLLLNNVDVKLILKPAANKWKLISSEVDEAYKLSLTDVQLFVRRVKVTPSLILAHERSLERATAKYCYNKVECSVRNLTMGLRTHKCGQIIEGNEIPKKIIFGFVSDTSLSGAYNENPFNFHHYNIQKATLKVEGREIAGSPLNFDFENGNYTRAFLSLIFNHMNENHTTMIDYNNYKSGLSLFGFNTAIDNDDNETLSLIRTGNCTLELVFNEALPHPVCLIVYSVKDQIFEIDRKRKILIED